MLASVATFALEGIDSLEVTVEIDMRRGLPVFTVVGLPDAGVREARERVRAALLNSGLEFPLQRLTANLAPASLRKAGPSFDLALAVAVLGGSGQVPREALRSYAVCGELSLSGALRPVHGALAVAFGAREAGYSKLLVPEENAGEAALVEGIEVLGVPSLDRIADLLRGRWCPAPARARVPAAERSDEIDLVDVRGQADGKRALEIAAGGGHSLLMVGPPGVGKTMLARRITSILPPPTFEEALEITHIHGVAGLSDGCLASRRPFRAPHHTISPAGLIGGGASPRPGEITLAHRGVLFLDELAEFSRPALEGLRQPLEDGRIEITRGQRTVSFPAEAMLIAACNSCPCARPRHECLCTEADRARYARRLSGPLMDRMDLVCPLSATPPLELAAGAGPASEASFAVRARVASARALQARRLIDCAAVSNATMDAAATRRHVGLGPGARSRLLEGHGRVPLSGRGRDRVLRLARTIADLGGRERVGADDIDEALSFRLGASERVAA